MKKVWKGFKFMSYSIVEKKGDRINEFMVTCFYAVLSAEEKALESISNGKLTLKEIHLIEAVFKTMEAGENNFSMISSFVGVTLGTLTTAYAKLEQKGYLTKERDKNDKRVYYIIPTRLAEMVHKEHVAWHERLVAGIIKRLPAHELENLEIALEHLSVFIGELK